MPDSNKSIGTSYCTRTHGKITLLNTCTHICYVSCPHTNSIYTVRDHMCVCKMPIVVSRRSEEAEPNLATTTTEKLQHLEVTELFIENEESVGWGGRKGDTPTCVLSPTPDTQSGKKSNPKLRRNLHWSQWSWHSAIWPHVHHLLMTNYFFLITTLHARNH
jgi:hypothetical protein